MPKIPSNCWSEIQNYGPILALDKYYKTLFEMYRIKDWSCGLSGKIFPTKRLTSKPKNCKTNKYINKTNF
jgi:hypothetical protein